ncbi:MAG: SLC13 family permease [Opitutaceae bacterium]|nr:SLC13 family permease [Opitutaceae bacterium]
MTWEIALVFVLLVGALVSFALEKVPADVTALTLMGVLIVTGLLPYKDALSVFANPGPLTVGAMFILCAALEKCGAIDVLARRVDRISKLPFEIVLLVLIVTVGGISAFINNTPVVVVFMPVVLSLARKSGVPASKLLMPMSFAAVLGGLCTLIGTSTNIVVSSIGEQKGLPKFGMFELACVGLPVFAVGTIYLVAIGRKFMPVRETLTSILSEEERREFITEAFVQPDSPHIGKTLKEAGLLNRRGIRVIEVVRSGVVMRDELTDIRLIAGDRLVLSCRPSGIAHTKRLAGIDFVAEAGLGLEQIAAHEGLLAEGVIGPHSVLVGSTIAEANIRQRYRVIIVAVHRRGKNLREHLSELRLEAGDTLLMLGTQQAVNNLRGGEDIILVDQPLVPTEGRDYSLPLVIGVIAAVVTVSSFDWMPIELAAFLACIVLFLTKAIRPQEGYASVQWNILFIIFAMLGMGIAMDRTHAAEWLSNEVMHVVGMFVAPEHKPVAMLVAIYFVTMLLTEILSNNAAGAIMATLAIELAEAMGVNARPFLIAVTIAASASFATPIGYQANTYIYGVGGYRFSDFVKVGVPLNLLAMVTAIFAILEFFPF